jgi:hypothetical protein
MWAEVELTQEIKLFIKKIRCTVEPFEEIKQIAFNEKMISKQYNISEMVYYSTLFHQIKKSAFDKVLKKKKLDLLEGIIFDRLLTKYNNEPLLPFNDYLKCINDNCIKPSKGKNY